MRYIKILKRPILILSILILGSCSPTLEIKSDQLVEKGGIKYQINSQTPFTGISVDYYEKDQLKSKRDFKKGKQEGPYEVYHKNGQLWFKENYKDGKPDGLWESYYDNGQLWSTGNYKDGKLDGLWEEYDVEGNLTKTEEWKNGKLIKQPLQHHLRYLFLQIRNLLTKVTI